MNNNQPSTKPINVMRVHLVLMASPILLAVVLVVTSLSPAPSLTDGSRAITERRKATIMTSAIPAGSTFYDFDLATQEKGAIVEQPQLVLPINNRYARRIETTAKVEFTTAIIELEQQTTELITTAASDITSDPLAIEFFYAQGMNLDPRRSLLKSNVYVAEYTPVVNGQPSDITQYRLFTVVDVSPQHLQMQQAWRDSQILQRLIKFCAVAGTTVLTLLVYRGNQIMIAQKTSPTTRLLFNITAWTTSFSAVAFLATNYF
ncbi:MAG: hypothetical protein VB814_12770 [Pirellulaceae bacterium]